MNILKEYHADAQEFLRETGYLPVNVEPANLGKLRKIPVISWVMAGRWSGAADPFQPGAAEEWTESDAKGPHVFALRVKGDSMAPEFNEGDIVVSPHSRAANGDYVVVGFLPWRDLHPQVCVALCWARGILRVCG